MCKRKQLLFSLEVVSVTTGVSTDYLFPLHRECTRSYLFECMFIAYLCVGLIGLGSDQIGFLD